MSRTRSTRAVSGGFGGLAEFLTWETFRFNWDAVALSLIEPHAYQSLRL